MPYRYVIWPILVLCFAIALFQVKHKSGKLQSEEARLDRAIQQNQQKVSDLKTEWSHLNQPGYIAALAGRHLDYDPDRRTHILNISQLPMREVEELVKINPASLAAREAIAELATRPDTEQGTDAQSPELSAELNAEPKAEPDVRASVRPRLKPKGSTGARPANAAQDLEALLSQYNTGGN